MNRRYKPYAHLKRWQLKREYCRLNNLVRQYQAEANEVLLEMGRKIKIEHGKKQTVKAMS